MTLIFVFAFGVACSRPDAPPPPTTPPAATAPAAPSAPAAPEPAPAPAPAEPRPAATPGAPVVLTEGWRVTPPAGWVAEPTSGGMRVAQYRLPRADGDSRDGEVTVIVAGGDVAANVTRWQAQFEGEAPAESVPVEVAGVELVRVAIAGTYLYKERPMAPGPAERIEDAVVDAVILPGSGGRSVFIKGWGPRATMARWSASWDTLIGSLERVAR